MADPIKPAPQTPRDALTILMMFTSLTAFLIALAICALIRQGSFNMQKGFAIAICLLISFLWSLTSCFLCWRLRDRIG